MKHPVSQGLMELAPPKMPIPVCRLINATGGIKVWLMRTLNAHFDGRFIVLDEPAGLKPDTKVTVVAPDANDDGLTDGCAHLSEFSFKTIWDNPLDADYDRL